MPYSKSLIVKKDITQRVQEIVDEQNKGKNLFLNKKKTVNTTFRDHVLRCLDTVQSLDLTKEEIHNFKIFPKKAFEMDNAKQFIHLVKHNELKAITDILQNSKHEFNYITQFVRRS